MRVRPGSAGHRDPACYEALLAAIFSTWHQVVPRRISCSWCQDHVSGAKSRSSPGLMRVVALGPRALVVADPSSGRQRKAELIFKCRPTLAVSSTIAESRRTQMLRSGARPPSIHRQRGCRLPGLTRDFASLKTFVIPASTRPHPEGIDTRNRGSGEQLGGWLARSRFAVARTSPPALGRAYAQPLVWTLPTSTKT